MQRTAEDLESASDQAVTSLERRTVPWEITGAERIVALQRAAGNRAVRQLVARQTPLPPTVKPPTALPPAPAALAPADDLEEAVARFKARLGVTHGRLKGPKRDPNTATDPVNRTLVTSGQFVWTTVALEQLTKRVHDLVPGDTPTEKDARVRLEKLGEEAAERRDVSKPMQAAKEAIARLDHVAVREALAKLLGSGNVEDKPGVDAYTFGWQEYRSKGTAPNFIARLSMTFTHLLSLSHAEKTKCADTAREVGKLNRPKSPSGTAGLGPSGWSTDKTTRSKEMKGTLVHGDLVLKNALPSATSDKLVTTLDAGWYVRAGVISGVHWDPPPPGKVAYDHFLLIVGHRKGTQFVFWDPDATASPLYGGGFGVLHLRDGRLTTAATDDNLFVWPLKHAKEGDHEKSGQHRYQVLSLEAV